MFTVEILVKTGNFLVKDGMYEECARYEIDFGSNTPINEQVNRASEPQNKILKKFWLILNPEWSPTSLENRMEPNRFSKRV